MTIQQFFNNLRDNQIVNDYIAYMKDTLGGGYINYYFEDGGQHYSGAPLPQFKYHNVKGNLHPVVWGGNIKTNLIQHLFGSTEKFFNGMCVFGEFTGSISAGSYGSRQGFIRPYMKSKDSDRNEQWQYVVSLRTGKKFLGDKYWAPANPDTSMEFYKYLGLAKNAVRVIQKESQKVLSDALDRLITAIQNDQDYITWKEADKVGASAEEVAPELKLSEVYYALKSLVKPGMRLDQSEDDEIQCSIRHWGRWDSDFDSDREEEDYEDDDYEVLSDASDQALNKIVSEIKEKFPQVDIDWGTSEKNWIDFTITRIANESLVTEAEAYVTDKFKVGDKIKTGFGEWEIIETDYAPKKSFMGPFIFKGDDMKRVNIPNPPKTNKNAVGYKVTDGDKYPIIGFLYQYKDITKLATVGVDESVVNEKDKHASTDFSKPGNDGDIYFSKREGDAVGIRLEDKLQMIYVFQEEPKLGRIQKTDKRWKNMGPASEELLIDLRGRTEGKILFDFVSTLEESTVTEGMSKSAIKKAIKVIDQQIEDEEGGNGEPLDNETLQALEQERERLLGMNEGKFSPMGYAKRVVDGSIKIKDAMKEAGISLGNIAKLIKKIDKSFNVDAAFLEKNVMQDDPEKFVESKKLKYVKVLNEGVDGYTYNKWIKENGKIKYPKWIEEQRKEIIKQGLMQPVYDSESQNMIIWINSFGKKFFPINADSKKREKEFGKNGSEFINRFYNDLTGYSAFFWQAATICLEIIRHIEDMQVNGESIEPSYYLAKEYFNNHGLDTKRSRIFNSTTEKLAVWMKDNNIETL